MRKAIKLSPLTTTEETESRKIAVSRKAALRLAQRAKMGVQPRPNSLAI